MQPGLKPNVETSKGIGVLKRRRIEFEIAFFAYIIAALASGITAFFIAKKLNKISASFYFGHGIWNAFVPLIVAVAFNILLTFSKEGYKFFPFTLFQAVKKSLKGTLITGAVWALILLASKNGVSQSRFFLALTLLINFILVAAFWYTIPRRMIRDFSKSSDASYVAIITTRNRAETAVAHISHDWARRLVGIGIADESFDIRDDDQIGGVPVRADASRLFRWVQTQAIDEAFVYLNQSQMYLAIPAVHEMIRMGIRVHIDLPEVEELNQKLKVIEEDGYAPTIHKDLKLTSDGDSILTLNQPTMRIRSVILKRTLDIIGGIVGLIITGILFIFVGIAIKLDSPGPIIFAQERIGKNGRHFKMYKFRSMYQDAEARKKDLLSKNEMNGLMFKMEDDPRITKVGKFIRKTSIDEFPQFWNVLKGDMSLVGTRPPTVGEFKQYNSYHKRRLAMKPGITGMWQVSGRSDITDFEEVVRLDCQYIDNWSMKLDIKILLETIAQVFRHKGAK